MKKNLLAGMIAALFATGASAFEPFTVMDIRVDGIQRTEAGTVFSYLPIKVGDVMNDDKAAQAIKALFATGFFKDVRIEIDGDVVVVAVEERPAIAQIDFVGLVEFEKDVLLKGLKDGDSVYFVHSFMAFSPEEYVDATCSYGTEVTAFVHFGNVYGAQFHPEKSGDLGLQIYRNFAGWKP